MNRTAALHNLGCKVNAYELDAMQEMLIRAGYIIVPFCEVADIYIINTCTVTNIADRKSRQMLHRAKKLNPKAIVVACGCYAQTSPQALRDDCAVDIIIGNNQKKQLVHIIENYIDKKIDNSIEDAAHYRKYEELSIERPSEHTRAYMKIQDGCNQFCSYCAIPLARGRVRSRPVRDVLDEARRLSENECKEIVLTGIHLSSYGVDIGSSLLEIIERVSDIDGIERIRLGSLEPGIITEDFAGRMAGFEKLCPHFHLSLQSGSDAILKLMNRRYTADEYRSKCDILRSFFDEPALTTDVIVGFPGETASEFDKTYSFVDSIDFFETHIFKYSRREGTKAAVMPDQIPEPVKEKRSEMLIGLGKKKRMQFLKKHTGSPLTVLFEKEIKDTKGHGSMYTGYTMKYIPVRVHSDECLTNSIRRVRPVTVCGDYVVAELFPLLFQ